MARLERATQLTSSLLHPFILVMAALVAAIHFPETEQNCSRFWKMDGPDEPGHDDLLFKNLCRTQLGGPLSGGP